MKTLNENAAAPIAELDDEVLEGVNGGVAIGEVVHCNSSTVQYCKGCGKLLQNYEATITGVRGVLEGKTVYWIKLGCCGYRTSVIETSIL
jgi:hypothetical protein